MKPIPQEMAVPPITGLFLEKKGLLRAALEKEAELAHHVPGYTINDSSTKSAPLDPVLRSLALLDLEKKLFNLASGGQPDRPVNSNVATQSVSSSGTASNRPQVEDGLKRPVVVIIRHGKTEYNKLGLFTGWEDAPLAEEGREEARKAGKLLKAHGVEFDVIYTSWLSRAIETAWIIMNQLDSLWLPIKKSWRLNERMYGALTGMSKKMIAQQHGEKKYME
eukprot:gene32458-54940_t